MINKILLVAPRSISKHNISDEPFRFDYSFWNFYLPLKELGYNVEFFDTSTEGDKELRKKVSSFNPDLLFCIMTGDKNYCPLEPWETIKDLKSSLGIRTYNWFCDDTWRFDSFSSKVCQIFDICSTTQKDSLDKYKSMGYNNIFLTNWHANDSLYGQVSGAKSADVTFVGGLHGQRKPYIDFLVNKGISVNNPKNCSFEEMVWEYKRSKICLNFSRCSVGSQNQMKARLFEVVASKSLLVSERVPNLESYFLEDKEIVLFSSAEELHQKVKFLLDNETHLNKITEAGYNRYIDDHTSKVRLQKVIEKIEQVTV
jgi:spore maturation protein CgeB